MAKPQRKLDVVEELDFPYSQSCGKHQTLIIKKRSESILYVIQILALNLIFIQFFFFKYKIRGCLSMENVIESN